jgi:hypothetical protein
MINDLDLTSEHLDTYGELLTETRKLLDQRDSQAEEHGRLEARYGDEISGDPGLQTYDQLADYYKSLSTLLSPGYEEEPSLEGMETYEKLKIGVHELQEQRDKYLQYREKERLLEEEKESQTDDPVEDGADRNYKFFFGTEDSQEDVVDHTDDSSERFLRDWGTDEEAVVDHVDDPAVDL